MNIGRWARLALMIVLAVTAAGLVSHEVFAADGPAIRAIEVTGTSLTEPETVKSRLTFSEGQRYDVR